MGTQISLEPTEPAAKALASKDNKITAHNIG